MVFGSTILDSYNKALEITQTQDGERLYLVVDVSLSSGESPLLVLTDWLVRVNLAGYTFFTVYMSRMEKKWKVKIAWSSDGCLLL